MSHDEAQAKERLLGTCTRALSAVTSVNGASTFFVPGRIEVLGKHTDYAGGRSLLCAMERGVVALSVARDDDVVRVINAHTGEQREVRLASAHGAEQGHWSAYFSTVAQRVARDFPNARRGADIAFASDLPAASGMSSSSTLVIAAFLALAESNDLEHDADYRRVVTSREVLGNYLGAVENGRSFGAFAAGAGVGTLGGSQDQTAILCCRAGMLSQYSFCPVRAEGEFPFPSDRVFVVAFSGVAAEKTANAMVRYNRASLAVSEILALGNSDSGRDDACLADASHDPSRIRALIAASRSNDFDVQQLLDRFDQFIAESVEIIPAASRALASGDLGSFGTLVDRSQQGAERLLGNQVPETIALASLARELGADAASAFGAGFGGSVWALVSADSSAGFTRRWREKYASRFSDAARRAEFILTRPGPPALVWR